MMRNPCFITAVHTCTVVDPSSMNSVASFQVLMPPMPETGALEVMGSWAMVVSIFSAMGLTAGPQYPPNVDLPPTLGFGMKVSRSTPLKDWIVLIREGALAAGFADARSVWTS